MNNIIMGYVQHDNGVCVQYANGCVHDNGVCTI